jgi:hypothetical protein
MHHPAEVDNLKQHCQPAKEPQAELCSQDANTSWWSVSRVVELMLPIAV